MSDDNLLRRAAPLGLGRGSLGRRGLLRRRARLVLRSRAPLPLVGGLEGRWHTHIISPAALCENDRGGGSVASAHVAALPRHALMRRDMR